jgi:serine-type D-Ala-D-Ala carboxypeptidase (penicillin-binding protein 5/6)
LAAVLRRLALVAAALAAALFPASSAAADHPPPVRARAALVANGNTGEILFERDADRRLAIASITKIMTALVTLERSDADETVAVQGRAPSVGESTIHLRAGERLPLRDLLAAALVQSANDAAFALAAHVAEGDVKRFVGLMNARAAELGLENTHFVRPDGLDIRGQYSTARDVFALAREAMKDSLFRKIVRMRGGEIAGGRSLYAWNDLLRTSSFPGIVGIKTGHTDAAGWSQVAAAHRDGVTIYAVILGSPARAARNADLAELLDWGFDQYGRVTLVAGGRRYASAEVPFSDERLPLVAGRPAVAVVRLGRPLVEKVVAPAMVELPVERGEKLGEIRIYAGAHVVARRALVAAKEVEEPGVGRRVGWYAGHALDEAGSMLGSVLSALG